jgi:quinol monooxygenase YgiN
MKHSRVMLIARFDGDIDALTAAYDRAHDLIMSRGGAVSVGELRHHCATSDDALYIIGVWESEEAVRARWASAEFKDLLASVGFPPTPTEMTILELRAIEPPLS